MLHGYRSGSARIVHFWFRGQMAGGESSPGRGYPARPVGSLNRIACDRLGGGSRLWLPGLRRPVHRQPACRDRLHHRRARLRRGLAADAGGEHRARCQFRPPGNPPQERLGGSRARGGSRGDPALVSGARVIRLFIVGKRSQRVVAMIMSVGGSQAENSRKASVSGGAPGWRIPGRLRFSSAPPLGRRRTHVTGCRWSWVDL